MKLRYSMLIIVGILLMMLSINTIKVNAATTIKPNKEISGRIEEGSSVEYTYTATGKGYFYVTAINTLEKTTRIKINVGDIEYNTFDCNEGEGWQKGDRLAFSKGTKVSITVINTFPNYYNTYSIKLVQSNPSNFETESNNKKSKADTIKSGKAIKGIVNTANDEDYYVFKAPKTAKYSFKVQNNYASAGSYGQVATDIYKGSKCLALNSITYKKDGTNIIYTGKIKKGTKIYIRITGTNQNDYKLSVVKK